MDLFTRADLKTLLAESRPGCVSLFMPTHRGGREADPIRWRTRLAQAEEQLIAGGRSAGQARELLAPARQLLEDVAFWKHQCDGLAGFVAPQSLHVYRLPLALEDLVVVGPRFQITPLLPLLSGNGRFYVLALSQNAVRLLQATRDSVSAVSLKGVPQNLAEALATHDRDEPLTFHTRPTSGGGWGAIFEGHGVGIDDAKDDLLRYFQRIDRGLHPLLREEQAPLVLAAVDYLQPLYRQASSYGYLLEGGIEGNPDRLSSQELHDRAWALVAPHFARVQEQALAQYRQLAGTGRTAHDLKEVVPAAAEGHIETLFVAQGRQCWGTYDPASGQVKEHAEGGPGAEDLLNLAALHTLQHGQHVYALEPERMPDRGLAAAIYRLPLPKRGKRP